MNDIPTPSIKVTTRNDRTVLMAVLQSIIRPFKGYVVKLGEPYPAGSPTLTPSKKASRRISCKERIVEDIRLYDLSPRQSTPRKDGEEKTGERRRKRVYWFAGGGWRSPPTGEHWALLGEFANKIPNASITVVSYPLAPDSPAPDTFPRLMKLYRRLLRDAEEAGEEVVLAGDSAGGNIVLCIIASALLEDEEQGQNLPCPKAIFAMSPSTDLRRQNPDMKAIEPHDPLLRIEFVNATAQSWCGDWDASDVRVSPLLADLTPLAKRGVKVHGLTGGYDILGPDAVLFREKCKEAGIEGEWLNWEKQMHCFPLAFSFKLRECVEAKNWIIDVLSRT